SGKPVRRRRIARLPARHRQPIGGAGTLQAGRELPLLKGHRHMELQPGIFEFAVCRAERFNRGACSTQTAPQKPNMKNMKFIKAVIPIAALVFMSLACHPDAEKTETSAAAKSYPLDTC